MPYSHISAADLESAFQATLQAKKGGFWTKEITTLFRWSSNHRLYWATTPDRRNAVAVVGPSGKIQMLTSSEGWKDLSAVLTAERGALPADLSPVEIAEAVRKLTVGPPGLVATAEMAQRNSPPRFAWMTDKPHGDETTFLRLCVTPVLEPAPDGRWRVVFNYFNDRGGVEHWTLDGDRRGLTEVKMQSLLPDGTFNWPFE